MIQLSKDGRHWNITIARTDKANSLTKAMLEEIDAHVQAASQSDVAVLSLTGMGKIFSAGADLDEARAGLATDGIWEQLSARIAALPCLSIAALNGTCAGGAFGMVLACDLRLADPAAKFFYPVMKLGFLPQPSDPGRMVALMGPARTKLMLLGGQKITAEEALSFGLLDRIVPAADQTAAVAEIAADCLNGTPDVMHAIKKMCRAPGAAG